MLESIIIMTLYHSIKSFHQNPINIVLTIIITYLVATSLIMALNLNCLSDDGTQYYSYLYNLTSLYSVPSAPLHLWITHTISERGFIVSWDPPRLTNDIVGYFVYLNGTMETVSSTMYRAGGLSPGSSYNITVRGFNSYGVGDSTSAVMTTLSGEWIIFC